MRESGRTLEEIARGLDESAWTLGRLGRCVCSDHRLSVISAMGRGEGGEDPVVVIGCSDCGGVAYLRVPHADWRPLRKSSPPSGS